MRIVIAMVALLLALASPALAAKVTLKGDVTYRERIALPPDGTLSVSLVDLAAPDQPRVSAKAPISSPGQVPLTFTLNFDDAVIVAGHSYALIAEIAGPDAVWFRNAEPYALDPLAPAGSILIIVNIVPQEAPVPTPEPVVAPAPSPILDITWQAETIGGAPVARGIVSSLSIASDMRAGGRGGCNSWFAQAEVNAERLIFSAVAATRMACVSDEATKQEDSFFAALAATRFWRLDKDHLILLDAGGVELANLGKSRF
ncbi:MAG: META domain-containing protein [Hyphomicrobiales bacterium]|nr:MAG: META domain-containing protein [Hyphomicrobiales bacterium]